MLTKFVGRVPANLWIALRTGNPVFGGEMKITIELADRDGDTEIVGLHEGLPEGVSIADNELGWRLALEKPASLVTTPQKHRDPLHPQQSRPLTNLLHCYNLLKG